MKKFVTLFGTIALVAISALADEFETVNGVTWRYYISDDGATICAYDYAGRYYPAISLSTEGALKIPDKLGGKNVTRIGDRAFIRCSGLTSVEIPSSVTQIGWFAFYGCSGLASVEIPSSVTTIEYQTFYGCNGLASVSIPSSVQSVATNAFEGCNSIMDVTAPGWKCNIDFSSVTNLVIAEGTTSISNSAFYACRALMSVTIPDSVTWIGKEAFSMCNSLTSVTIPDSVTWIGEKAFSMCNSLTSVYVTDIAKWCGISFGDYSANPLSYAHNLYLNGTKVTNLVIPDSVTSIGYRAFESCKCLTSVTIPDGVTSIGNGAFSSCSGLTSVTIPNSVTSIGENAFSSCSGLAAVDIPSHVWSIGKSAFYNCSGLVSVKIRSGVWGGVGDQAFYGCNAIRDVVLPGKSCGINLSSVTNLVVAYGTTSIGNSAFKDCNEIVSVTIPSSVTSIGNSAFYNCRGLTSLEIPSGVTSVGDSAFYNCSGLTSIEIPSSVTRIGNLAFYGCNAIRDVVVPGWKCGIDFSSVTNLVIAEGAASIGSSAFPDCRGLTSVTILPGVTNIGHSAFQGCEGLVTVSIPESVTSIGSCAFTGCVNIVSLNVPSWVDVASVFSDSKEKITHVTLITHGNVPASAYCGCSSIERVDVASVADWLSFNFASADSSPLHTGASLYIDGEEVLEIEIPEGTINLSDFAFQGGHFVSVTMPEGLANVGTNAFAECDELGRVNVPSIKDWLQLNFPTRAANPLHKGAAFFVGGEELLELVIPEGTTEIADYAFAGGQFESVVMPNSVTNIAGTAFAGCSNVVSLTVPSCVDVATVFADSMDKISQVTLLPQGEVPVSAYRGCSALTRVDIPSMEDWLSLRFVDEESNPLHEGAALYIGDREITELVIPGGMTELGSYAFSGGRFVSVVIPTSMTNVASTAFSGCANIKSVDFGNWPIMHYEMCLHEPEATKWSNVNGVYQTERQDDQGAQTPVLKLKVSGPKNLSFRWKATYCGNFLRYYLDGIQQSYLCYSLPEDWQEVSMVLEAGVHEIKWEYDIPKYFGNYGDYYGWVDLSEWSYYAPIEMSRLFPDSYAKIKKVSIPDSVMTIGAYSFSGCTSLDNVILPSNVTNIEASAFAGCDNLTRISLSPTITSLGDWDLRSLEVDGSTSVDGFRICDGWILGYDDDTVARLELPDGIIGIAPYALSDLWDLEEVVLPESLKYIGYRAFMNDTFLDNVVIPDSVEYVDCEAFMNCTYLRDVVIGSRVKKIGNKAFANCTQLVALSIPDGVAEIGDYAFSNCWRMLSIKLPLDLEFIGEDMFASCSSLVGVSVPSGKFTMSQLLGARSGSITSAVIVDGETVICTNAFSNCTLLETICIPEGVTNIQAEAFRNCFRLRDVVLPETLEMIEPQAFYGCSYLGAIVLPDSVTVIGNGAFRSCSSLNSVTLSRNLIEVPDYAFYGCNSLVSIVVPTSVARLGAYISDKLSSLYFLGNAPTYDANAYASLPSNAKTYVVQGSRGWDGIPSSRDLPSSWIGRGITTWMPNRFYATFDANDGLFPDQSVTYGCEQITDTSYAIPPFEPTRTAYAFAGWWTDRTAGAQVTATTRVNETRDITFYAHWTLVNKPVSVRFFANGGTVEPEEATYYAGLTYQTLPVPTKEHYRFTGWYTMAEGGTQVQVSSEVPAAGAELFAHWSPETYVIRYNANGGNGSMADQSFVYGSSVTLRANSFWRQNCSFTGWGVTADGPVMYADKKELSTIGAIQGGVINLYAQWTATQYAVRYDSNGGVGSMTNDTFTTGISATLSQNAFTKAGYVFIGWATTVDGEVVYGDGEVVADLTSTANGSVSLFAVWARNTSNVMLSFEGDDKAWRTAKFAKDGEVVWQSGDIGNGETSTLVATVNGSGTISFDWSSSCEDSFRGMRLDYVAFFIDGEEKEFLNGNSAWATKSYVIEGAGQHVLKWQYIKDSEGSDFEDCVRISGVSWERSLSTLEEFANADSLTFVTTGDAVWSGQTAVSHDGVAALQSGVISDGEESRLECEAVGAGELSFWWKVSSEEPFRGILLDYASFELDGVRQSWIAGETDWTNVTISITGAGKHTFSWIYSKDEWVGTSAGGDSAWLDEVMWTPTRPFPEVATNAAPETVAAAFLGAADAGLVANVVDGTNYNAFCEWAARVKGASGLEAAGAQTVKGSAKAWLSYALGADRLITIEPRSDDVKIESFTPTSTDGKFEFMVSVKDVNIGGGSVAEDVLKENLKKVLNIEGTKSLSSGAFSSDNIDITFDTPVDGKAKFTVSLPIDAGNLFFMRVKVK